MADLSFIRPEEFMPTVDPENALTEALLRRPADNPVASVQALLSQLDTARPPEPHKLKTWQRVLGGLGDAIQAMAAVRAGGQAPAIGPFAAGQRERRMMYEQQVADVDKFNRETERMVRVGQFEEAARLKREKEVASIRAVPKQRPFQLKQFSGTDEAGRPIRIPYNYDPNSGTLAPAPGYEQGFTQYIRPFLAQGVNADTGELEFKLVDPFGGAPGGGGGTPLTVKDIEPKPTAGEAESVEAASVIQTQLKEFKDLASTYAQNPRILGTVRSLGQNVVRELPGGQALSETMGDPEFEKLAALRDRIGQQLARLVESGRLSDQDREFALRNLPTVPALTTQTGRKAAVAKIALVEQEISLRLARKRRLRPALTGGGGGPYSGKTLHESDFADAAPGERERFIAGGGTVEP